MENSGKTKAELRDREGKQIMKRELQQYPRLPLLVQAVAWRFRHDDKDKRGFVGTQWYPDGKSLRYVYLTDRCHIYIFE